MTILMPNESEEPENYVRCTIITDCVCKNSRFDEIKQSR